MHAKPAAQRDLGKIRSLGLQFAPELTTIVTAFGPPLFQVGEPTIYRGASGRDLAFGKLSRTQPIAYGFPIKP